MKTKNVFLILVMLSSIVTLKAQTKMFSKLSDNKDISVVYVSKAMMGMAGDMNLGNIRVKGLMDKLEQIEIYTTENNEARTLMVSEAKSLLQHKTYETLMSVKEGQENITFYGHKENDKFKDLIMLVDEPGECVVIRFIGTFTSEDIQGVMDISGGKAE